MCRLITLWTITGDVTIGAPSTFTAPAAGVDFPPFTGTVLGGAVGVEVALEALEPVNGTVDSTTGAVATSESDFKATLTLDFTPVQPAGPDGRLRDLADPDGVQHDAAVPVAVRRRPVHRRSREPRH